MLPASHVDVGVLGDRLRGFFIEGTNRAGRHSEDQGVVGEFLALGHHGPGSDEAIPSDPRAVEHDRAHADEAVGRDAATVQDHIMADDAVLADLEGKARIGVQHRVVLDLGALAQLDPLVVPAQHRVEPDAGVGLEPHAPNDDGAIGDPITAIRRQLRRLAVKLEDCHSRPPLSEGATLP